MGNLLRRGAGNLKSRCRLLMADYRLSIGSEAHIELEAVATVGQGLVEGRECILRNRLEGAGAAVAEKKRTAHTGKISQDRNPESACRCRGSLSPSSRPPGTSSRGGRRHAYGLPPP